MRWLRRGMLAVQLLVPGLVWAGPVHLAWNAVTGASSYNIYRSTTTGGPYTRQNDSPVMSPFYSDDNVDAGMTYFYVVTAVGSGNESGYSNELKVVAGKYDPTSAAETPAARTRPPVTARSGQLVVLSGTGWDPEDRSLTFSWSQVVGPAVPIIGANKPEAAFIAPQVTKDTLFAFTLTVTSSDGSVAFDTIYVAISF